MTRWLHVPGIIDPVDRRNAPILQLALLALGTAPPLLWLYRIFGTDIAWRPGETLSLLISLLISALALWSVLLIRRKRFQRAIRQLMAIVALLTIASHAANGLAAHMFEMPVQLLWLFIAGMMIGRRALWAMFGALALALLLGAFAEARLEQADLDAYLGDAVIRSIMFLIIALVIDRSVAALRESLDDAVLRGVQLEQANARLQAEMAAREQAQAQLLHAQKMEAVGRMASGLAHDFGHLLTLIDGYAGQAQRAGAQQERAAALEGVRSATRRAHAQVGKLMHFARADTPLIETLDAVEALQAIAPMLRQTLGPSIVFRLQLATGPLPIRVDRDQFALMLLNIAANALDAMPDGGEFAISADVDRSAKRLELRLSDTGPGIPEAARPYVFQPFFTTKPLGHGTGLGLAVSQDLAESWGGSLSCTVPPAAGGTVFVLTLPLAE
ncbi:sensor histidine kinase [Luteimonas sp. SDU101]|uniref:sensor histidine kinase n=1 Tax=Luteimonas sp. SDU101 TaxID=3422593 RepID=UPI003EBBF6CF